MKSLVEKLLNNDKDEENKNVVAEDRRPNFFKQALEFVKEKSNVHFWINLGK